MLRPGVASVRLWADTVQALAANDLCATVIPGVKTTITRFAPDAVTERPAPLRAVYVLEPMGDDADDKGTVRRERLAGVPAAVALAHQTKLPVPLIGLRAAGTQLAAAAAIAASVPVYALPVVRDFARLPELVAQILEWHRGDGP
jgi:hypothetical protein